MSDSDNSVNFDDIRDRMRNDPNDTTDEDSDDEDLELEDDQGGNDGEFSGSETKGVTKNINMWAIDDMSTINGKPVDATGKLKIHFDLKECKAPIEKVFGVVLKASNVVLKFNSILLYRPSTCDDTKVYYQFKLIYLSEDPIDCKIQKGTEKPDFSQNLTCGNQVYEKIIQFTDVGWTCLPLLTQGVAWKNDLS
jgi:hypothetical protein